MSSAKNIQAKVFGGGQDSANGSQSPAANMSPPSDPPSLSIQIPKPPPLHFNNHKAKDSKPQSDEPVPPRKATNGFVRHSSSYRERLLRKLGTRYDGVERHRLEQDERKERHWKRWGPYLSERQWVGSIIFLSGVEFHIG